MKLTSILDLPEHVLANVFKSRAATLGGDLPAIQSTCKAFRKAVDTDVYLKLMARVAQLADASAARVHSSDRNSLDLHIPVLPLLSRKQRAYLVEKCALHDEVAGGSLYPMLHLADGISHAARGLAHLDKPLQAKVVDLAIRSTDGHLFVSVLSELVPQLAHLDETWRNQLADKAIGLEEEKDRSAAIHEFGAGLAGLKQAKQKDLLTAAIGISQEPWRGHAIGGLCKGLKSLHADEQKVLLEKATQVPPGWYQASAFANLGESLGALSPDQRTHLVRGALGQGEDVFKAIAGLAAGLEHLEPHQIDPLVTASTAHPGAWHVEEAIAALGTKLHLLTETQQDELLDTVTRLDNRKAAIAIASLAAGFASLDSSVRKDRLGDRLVDMAQSLSGPSKAQALAALCARLGDLGQGRHQDLVGAAIGLFEDGRGLGGSDVRLLSAGLGAGWGSLHPNLRSALVRTVSRLQSPDDQSRDRLAQAIAGLGAALPHLDEAHCNTLLDAAEGLRPPYGSLESTRYRERALLGFAAEAAKRASRASETV